MLFVSHDRTFLQGLANRVLEVGGEDAPASPSPAAGPAGSTSSVRVKRRRGSTRRRVHPGTGPRCRRGGASRVRRQAAFSARTGFVAVIDPPGAAAYTHSQPTAFVRFSCRPSSDLRRPPALKTLSHRHLHCLRPSGTRPAMASSRVGSRIPGAQARRDAPVRADRVPLRERQGRLGGPLRAPVWLLARPPRLRGRAVSRLRHLRARLRPHPLSRLRRRVPARLLV